MLLTAAGSEVALVYDGNGTVTAVTVLNPEAQNILADTQALVGQSCTDAVTELVTQIGEAGCFSEDSADTAITISTDAQAEALAGEVLQQVQTVVTSRQWNSTVSMNTTAATEPTGAAPTEPATMTPSLPDNVPANAQLQSDGTYLLTEQVDLSGNPVSGDAVPAYTHQRSCNADGDPLFDQLLRYETGTLYAETIWEYDAQGNCVSCEYAQYLSSGTIQRGYREDYDAAGRLIQKAEHGKDGALTASLSYAYYDNGNLKLEEQVSGNGIPLKRTEYYDDGVIMTSTTWQDDGIMRYYSEYFPNGEIKGTKQWGTTGLPETEFTVFDGGVGNIRIFYDAQGNMTSRQVNNNPDGTPDTSENWLEDGTYTKLIFIDPDKGIFEFETHYPDGGYSWEYTNPVEDRSHIIIRDVTNKEGTLTNSDSTTCISTQLPIEGYSESTLADGSYYYIQWVDGYIYKEISDGVTFEGYAYRATVYYYLTGTYPNRNAIKSSDLYFFADGGHVYTEFDEDGNETLVEDTTNCN